MKSPLIWRRRHWNCLLPSTIFQNSRLNWEAKNVLSRLRLTPAANQCRKAVHGGDGDGHNGTYDEQVYRILSWLLVFYLGLTNSPRLADTCFKKCVNSDYKETELNKGESVCLDRCVNKFVEAFQKVVLFSIQPRNPPPPPLKRRIS